MECYKNLSNNDFDRTLTHCYGNPSAVCTRPLCKHNNVMYAQRKNAIKREYSEAN